CTRTHWRCRYAPCECNVRCCVRSANRGSTTEELAAMRRMAEYAARHAPGRHDEHEVRAVQQVTDFWVQRVTAAIDAGIPADSPVADSIVIDIIGAWLPTQEGSDLRPSGDGEHARSRLLEQLEIAADPRAERYWQLLCVINGWPVRPSLAAAGQWLMTA